MAKYKDSVDEKLSVYGLYKSEYDLQHHSYESEQMFDKLLKEGRLQPIFDLIDDSSRFGLGLMSRSEFKQSEYLGVILITKAVRIAIGAGINPYRAYDLNDLYLQELSEAHSIEEHKRIMRDAIRKLHELMKNEDEAKSARVEACKNYIATHLHKAFTLKELAESVGVTPTYLSAHFSQMEHITIKEYTVQQRISAAQNMLRATDYPIGLISEYLLFCSQSYFSTVFKKRTGYTPQQYRNRFSK